MNKSILSTILTVLLFSTLPAQKFQFGGIAAYQIGGIFEETTQSGGVFTYRDGLGISSSESYGAYLNIQLIPKMRLEVSWDRQLSQLNFHQADSHSVDIDNRVVTKISDLNVDYYLVGLIYDWSLDVYQPFFGVSVGLVRMAPQGDFETETRPGFAPVLGINMFMSPNFAFRAHVRFMVAHIPDRELFKNRAGEGFHHERETFMIQYQFGLGFVVNL